MQVLRVLFFNDWVEEADRSFSHKNFPDAKRVRFLQVDRIKELVERVVGKGIATRIHLTVKIYLKLELLVCLHDLVQLLFVLFFELLYATVEDLADSLIQSVALRKVVNMQVIENLLFLLPVD